MTLSEISRGRQVGNTTGATLETSGAGSARDSLPPNASAFNRGQMQASGSYYESMGATVAP